MIGFVEKTSHCKKLRLGDHSGILDTELCEMFSCYIFHNFCR